MKKYLIDGKWMSFEEIDKYVDNFIKHPHAKIRKALDFIEGDNVLDIGCWVGHISYLASRRHKSVVGVDNRPEFIEVAKKKFNEPNLTFKVMDAHNLDFPPNTFNTVLLLDVIEHLEEPIRVLIKIQSIIKPNGVLIISTPNAWNYTNFIDAITARIWKQYEIQILKKIEKRWDLRMPGTEQEHKYLWDIFTLYRLLYSQNFKCVDYSFVETRKRTMLFFIPKLIDRFSNILIMKLRVMK